MRYLPVEIWTNDRKTGELHPKGVRGARRIEMLIEYQVHSKTTLLNLVQVSRASRTSSRLSCMKHISIELEQLDTMNLENKGLPPGLRHVKVLDISVEE